MMCFARAHYTYVYGFDKSLLKTGAFLQQSLETPNLWRKYRS